MLDVVGAEEAAQPNEPALVLHGLDDVGTRRALASAGVPFVHVLW
ncbi:MAG: hypothetical protein U1F43_37530 [Myxococcota bacterium]